MNTHKGSHATSSKRNFGFTSSLGEGGVGRLRLVGLLSFEGFLEVFNSSSLHSVASGRAFSLCNQWWFKSGCPHHETHTHTNNRERQPGSHHSCGQITRHSHRRQDQRRTRNRDPSQNRGLVTYVGYVCSFIVTSTSRQRSSVMSGASRFLGSRGVSQVIAALLLIAIVVAAAVLLYAYSLGLSGRLGSGGGQQIAERLILAAYRWSGNPGVLTGVVKNVGQTSIDVGGTDVFLSAVRINGGLGGGCGSATLDPSQSCSFQFTLPVGSWISGAAYSLRLVTPSGGIFSYSVIQGGSG